MRESNLSLYEAFQGESPTTMAASLKSELTAASVFRVCFATCSESPFVSPGMPRFGRRFRKQIVSASPTPLADSSCGPLIRRVLLRQGGLGPANEIAWP